MRRPALPAALAVALFVALLGLTAPASSAGAAPGAAPQTSLADIEDEVMCPICGTLLELANSPQAQRQRALIEKLIADGKSKEEIEDVLVAEYGEQVLAQPPRSGFDLSAYLVPLVAFSIAIAALAISVARWRRRSGPSSSSRPAAAQSPQGEEAERLDADLARYDL